MWCILLELKEVKGKETQNVTTGRDCKLAALRQIQFSKEFYLVIRMPLGSHFFPIFTVPIFRLVLQGPHLASEKAMAPHSSTLAWKIPRTEEPGGLQWAHGVAKSQTRLSDFLFTFMHWRRKWQPTPVFLPGESQGRWNLVGCRLWGHTESDMTEVT